MPKKSGDTRVKPKKVAAKQQRKAKKEIIAANKKRTNKARPKRPSKAVWYARAQAMLENQPATAKRLSVKQVAEMLGYNPFTIYKWARIGRIPCIRMRRQIRFRLSDILEWEREQTTGKL